MLKVWELEDEAVKKERVAFKVEAEEGRVTREGRCKHGKVTLILLALGQYTCFFNLLVMKCSRQYEISILDSDLVARGSFWVWVKLHTGANAVKHIKA